MIDGVKVKPLKMICDERGRLTEVLRRDEPFFRRFGQVYMTTAYPGVVKGWHYHKVQWDNFCCVSGMMKLVLWDGRKGSKTRSEVNEFFLGTHNMIVVTIPPLVYHGFKGISPEESIVINIPTEPYHHAAPDEFRLPAHTKKIPYRWEREDR
ncbi:MAG: dTDP-4-dehydrorhamnose 3,5-epimerase family protein [Planctomycetes bacterium]|nr:dTDP-4-dehydrorhamnose 3,5-epimerase family protein [Planctomycetota bacterium]